MAAASGDQPLVNGVSQPTIALELQADRDQHSDEHHRGDGRRDRAQPEEPRSTGDQAQPPGQQRRSGEELTNRSSHPATLANAFGRGGVWMGMRLRRALLALLLALLAVGVAPPLAAYAGGPTSVLMVNPNLERAGAAYHSDALYTELVDGVGDGPVGASGPPRGLAAGGGEDVRLTWLVHDMLIWRIDRIHLTSADGLWIETVVDRTGEGQRSTSRPPGTGPPTPTGSGRPVHRRAAG